ncbi:DUF2474 family protein [Oricola cellulosilytica]|uniref:DUF2474 family protein n=1 Tax=Oricola cellulosilytica TaxID=1429082 RepID=A0A4V2MNA0_9HYPH|nr:DUF2474 family protein [Oricola cellulosilytica]TCD11948.1 DUF2474 family protein [Oricola cellulosilytica]
MALARRTRQIAWFIALWLAGVACVAAVAYFIRLAIN